jgi:hypothetical protein
MGLGRRAAALVAVLAAALPAGGSELGDRVTLNGYTNFEFERQLGSQGFGDPSGSFDADQFDLVFNIQVTDRVRVASDLSWEHGTATEDGRGNQALEYGFVEYTVSDLLKVRLGKMFTPFGVYNEIHTAKPAFLSVKEAASVNKTDRIVEDGLLFYPRWGAGIALHGDGVVAGRDWNYDVLFANGEQETTNPFEEDDNAAKSVTARVRVDATPNLRVGMSFYRDQLASGDFSSVQSHGLELEWTRGRFRLQAEAAMGWFHRRQGATRRQTGWYLQPSWHFASGVTPYLRFDRVDPEAGSDDDHGSDLIAGLNYEVAKGFQLKVENNWFRGARASEYDELSGRDYHELKAAVVLGF